MPPSKTHYRLKEWLDRAPIGRSTTYRKIASGEIEAVKCGKRILIVAESGERFLESLPRAVIKSDKTA
jgi:excisionase family DNA binding protein